MTISDPKVIVNGEGEGGGGKGGVCCEALRSERRVEGREGGLLGGTRCILFSFCSVDEEF